MRLIDADALLYNLEIVPLTGDGGVDINDLEDIVKQQSTIEERRTGHWTGSNYVGEEFGVFICSECSKASLQDTDYCPHCGCLMKEVEHDRG